VTIRSCFRYLLSHTLIIIMLRIQCVNETGQRLNMRRASSGYGSAGLAAICAVLLGLSGCASDDDPGIGMQTPTVEGLVEAPAPLQPTVPSAAMVPAAAPVASLRLAGYVAPAATVEPTLSPADVDREADRLRQAMAAAVPDAIHLSPARQDVLIALGQQMAAADHLFIRQPQLVLIIDRAPRAQLLAMALARSDGNWEILGTSHISTGKPGRLQMRSTGSWIATASSMPRSNGWATPTSATGRCCRMNSSPRRSRATR
jgi:hypothetical protein